MEQFVNGIPRLVIDESGFFAFDVGTMEESVAAWENLKQFLEPHIVRERT